MRIKRNAAIHGEQLDFRFIGDKRYAAPRVIRPVWVTNKSISTVWDSVGTDGKALITWNDPPI